MDIDVEAYDSALSGQAQEAERFVRGSLHEFLRNNPGATAQELADYAQTVLSQAFREYGGAASALACSRYDETAKALGVDVEAARADGEAPEGQENPYAIVEAHAKKADAGDFGGFISAVAAAASDHARFSAARTTIRNSEREDDFSKGMRFARVPTGRETCGFCVMLASRGFAYTSKEEAGAVPFAWYNRFHFHCDCRVVAGNEGTTVPGYNPEWYRKVYEDAANTCGSMDPRDICREIETRAPQWVYRGEPGKATYKKPREDFSGIDGKRDLFAHDVLTEKGIDFEARREDAPDGFANIDLCIGGELWELKSPESDKLRAVESNLRKAKKQFGHPYLHDGEKAKKIKVVFNGKYMGVADGEIEKALVDEMKKHGIDEVLFVMKDGNIRRHKNE